MTDRLSAAGVSFEMLNAYVDGELDAAQAAAVARAIADHPALAQEVASLTRLRSAIADSLDLPAVVLPEPHRPVRRGRRLAAVAGAAMLLLFAAAGLVAHLDTGRSPLWLADAWQAHGTWSADAPALTPARGENAGPLATAFVPDLTASRLHLVHSRVHVMAGGARALITGYRGSRGCKVSLVVFPARGDLGDTLQVLRRGGRDAFGWRTGDLDYVILSDGMEQRRFHLLAESVRDSSRRHAPFDAETRMALRESRDSSAPCPA